MSRKFEVETMEKMESKVSVGIYAVSGAGKTTAALKLAKGIQEQLYPKEKLIDIGGYIDTEKKSATKSIGRTVAGEKLEPMKYINFEPPYSLYDLMEAIDALKNQGCKILVIDSYSHFWSGKSGVLDKASEIEKILSERGKLKQYGAWSEKEIIDLKHILKDIITSSDMHIIFCMRAKTEYEIEPSKSGKTTIRAIGVKPDMQGDVEYEPDLVINIDRQKHTIYPMKDRLGFTEYRLVTPNPDSPITIEDGKELAKLATAGIPLEELNKKKKETLIQFILKEKSVKSSKVKAVEASTKKEFTKESLSKLSLPQLTKIVNYIK